MKASSFADVEAIAMTTLHLIGESVTIVVDCGGIKGRSERLKLG